MERVDFYKNAVKKFIKLKTDTVLICGAGSKDKDVFENLGFKNVTLSNLDYSDEQKIISSYDSSFQNAECLTYNDNSFDYVVVHASLHHMSNPHKALTEMYRVAKKGVLSIESRDSIFMRFLEKIGFTQTYECAAVYYNDCKFGGVNNTQIPNFIYRWTEREIEKTIQTYAPYYKHKIEYVYGSADAEQVKISKNLILKIFYYIFFKPIYLVFSKIFTKQQNLFAFFINKNLKYEGIFSWLEYDKQKFFFNKAWGKKTYERNE